MLLYLAQCTAYLARRLPLTSSIFFMLVTAPVIIVFALAVPAGEVPDEVAHILRADSVRHGEIAGHRRPRLDDQGDPAVDVVVRADASLLAAGFAFHPGIPLTDKAVTQQRLTALLGIQWTNRLENVSIPNTAVYPPLLYLPAATAMHLAKLASAKPYVSIIFARLVNGALYLCCGALALRLARRGRLALFSVLCLPMCLSLAASVNQDGLVIACAGLSAALLTRGTRPSWWFGVLLFGVAAMPKPYLLPLAFLILATMPAGLKKQFGPGFGAMALAVGPTITWIVAMAVFVAAPFVRGPAQPAGPLYSGAPGTMFATTSPTEQLHILLEAPWRLVMLPLNSALMKGDWLWREGVGVIGTLDVILPAELYTVWGWALVLAIVAGFSAIPQQSKAFHLVTVVAVLVGSVLAVWGIYVLQYLSWTRVGDAMIDGVQGRYFIPIAILALPVLAFSQGRRGPDTVLRIALSLPVISIAIIDMVVLPIVTLSSYYVR